MHENDINLHSKIIKDVINSHKLFARKLPREAKPYIGR